MANLNHDILSKITELKLQKNFFEVMLIILVKQLISFIQGLKSSNSTDYLYIDRVTYLKTGGTVH